VSIRKIMILAVLALFTASLAYGAEAQSVWQRMRNRFFPSKVAVKSDVAKPAVAKPAAAKSAAMPAPLQREEAEAKARKDRSAMTKEELLADIRDNLDSEDEILNYVPSLKKSQDAEGKNIYLFHGVLLKDVSRDGLEKLSVTVAQISTKIRTDRIVNQLESIRQAQSVSRMQNIMRPPRIVTPPAQPPQTPRAPSPTANIPSAPPSPPRR